MINDEIVHILVLHFIKNIGDKIKNKLNKYIIIIHFFQCQLLKNAFRILLYGIYAYNLKLVV